METKKLVVFGLGQRGKEFFTSARLKILKQKAS